jgi:hypothetical protein
VVIVVALVGFIPGGVTGCHGQRMAVNTRVMFQARPPAHQSKTRQDRRTTCTITDSEPETMDHVAA